VDGGTDATQSPATEQPKPSSESYLDLGCIYVGDALALDGETWQRFGIGAKLSSDQHGASIANGKICWYKGEDLPERLPFDLRMPPESGAKATEIPSAGTACSDMVTADRIGQEDFEEFGIAEKLEKGLFQREASQDHVACWYQRMIGEAIVEGDHLYYLFDPETGELRKKQVWWRSDLTEHQSSPLISREEAEATVQAEAQHSLLVILHPDGDTFRELNRSPADSDSIQNTKPTTQNPYWVVFSYTGQANEDTPMRLTVVDAMTGKVLGHTSLH
jgi:hypothetical protein